MPFKVGADRFPLGGIKAQQQQQVVVVFDLFLFRTLSSGSGSRLASRLHIWPLRAPDEIKPISNVVMAGGEVKADEG